MKSSTKQWLKFVKADIEAAEFLFKHGQKLGSANIIIVFHCHQAVEKAIKAVMNEKDIPIVKIHNLVRLAALAKLDAPANVQSAIADLNPHYLTPRYPDLKFKPTFSFTYNHRNTKQILSMTNKILIWLEQKINQTKIAE